jgi:hypothetical protein
MRDAPHVDFMRLSAEIRRAPKDAVMRAYGLVDADNVSQEIYAAHIALRAAQRALDDAVEHAGSLGLSWTAIGRSLGITRQAAQQRFGS